MAGDRAPGKGGDRSPWPAVAAIGGLLAGVGTVVGVFLGGRDEPPVGAPGSATGPAGPTGTTPPSSGPEPDDGDGDGDGTETPSPPPDDVVSEGSTVVAVGDAFDVDDDGEPDLAWDGFTVSWIDSRIAAAPPGPSADRCREVLSGVPGADRVSTVGAGTPPEEDCVETSGGVVVLAEVAYDDASGGLAVTWTVWG